MDDQAIGEIFARLGASEALLKRALEEFKIRDEDFRAAEQKASAQREANNACLNSLAGKVDRLSDVVLGDPKREDRKGLDQRVEDIEKILVGLAASKKTIAFGISIIVGLGAIINYGVTWFESALHPWSGKH